MEADMLLTHLQLEQLNIIHGASPRQKHSGILSYGYSFCGYDLRLDSKFYRFTCCSTNGHNDAKKPLIVDVKQFAKNPDLFKEHFVLCEESYRIVLNGHESILACTMEEVHMPRHCAGIVLGKSTYARCGLLVNSTPIEPGWYGQVTLELHNLLPCPLAIYVGEGIAQLLVFSLTQEVPDGYGSGKYQGQRGPVLPKV
jgi:dCTP deaminase